MVERFVLDGQQARLTQAALETLAVVAYRQPVTRARVSAVRGVNVDGVMRTLLTRGLVEEAGTTRRPAAMLYRTTELLPGADRAADLSTSCPRSARSCPDVDGIDDVLSRGRRRPRNPRQPGPRRPRARHRERTAAPQPADASRRPGRRPAAEAARPAGVASRRECEELIAAGRVEVDGEVVTELGTIDPASRRHPGRRQAVVLRADHVYLVLNKPRGVVSTMRDEGRPNLGRLRRRTGPSGCSTSAGSTPTPRG